MRSIWKVKLANIWMLIGYGGWGEGEGKGEGRTRHGVEARAVDRNQSHIIRIRFSGSKDFVQF